MDLNKLNDIIEKKIENNENKIVFTYYEMRISQNLKESETLDAIHLISIKLENLGYKIYRTNQEYMVNNEKYIVNTNELLVAIKK